MGTSGGDIDDAQLDAYIRLIDDAAYIEIAKSLDVAAGLHRLLAEVDSDQVPGGPDKGPITRDKI
jgi:hypothetical protein